VEQTEVLSGVDPAARRPDAFLSYSRRDAAAAARLIDLLAAAGKDVWVDRADIPAATRWRDELARAIEVSDAVIALVTPASVASENCRHELEHADAAGKRVIPVLAEPVDRVPDGLAARQWIELPAGDDWSDAIARIVDAIDTDLPYVRAHARYLEESQRWIGQDRDRGFLLRGKELAAAEEWLGTRSEQVEPRPTPDQIAFIQASRRDATRRQRMLIAGVSAAAAIAIVLGVVALLQRNTAVDREQTARSRELAATAETRRASDPEAAVRLAAEGVGVKDTAQAEVALRRAIAASPLVARVGSVGDEVNAAGITPDGETVVVAGRDGRVRALAVADGATRWSWQGTPALQSVLVASSGDEVAVGQGTAVQVLRTADGSPLDRYPVLRKGHIATGVISPDGARVATAAADLGTTTGSAGLWARGGARPIADLSAGDVAQRPDFSADGALLAIPYFSGVARIWDGRSGDLLHVLRGHRALVNDVAIDPRSRWAATASADGTARLWDAATGAEEDVLPAGDGTPVVFVAFSPDGRRLATGAQGGALAVWAVPSGRRLATLAGHEGGVQQGEWLDGNTLVTGSLDGSARVWDVARERQAEVLRGHGLGVRVAPLGRAGHLLTVGDEGTARVWRLGAVGAGTIGEPGETARVALADDGRRLATSNSTELSARLWALAASGTAAPGASSETGLDADLSDGGAVFSTVADGLLLVSPEDGAERPLASGVFSAVRIDRGGARVAGRRFTGGVDLVDAATGEAVASFPRASAVGIVQDMAFSADGRRLALSESGGPIAVYDGSTGEPLGRVPAPERTSLPAFAIDGAGTRAFRLDYGFPDARPAIVDVATGEATELSGEAPGALDAAAFNGDGRELLTAGGGAAQVWDAADGALLAELGVGRSRTSTAAYSPDDRLVVTGHDDGVVRVWDRATSALLGEGDGGPGPVGQVATAFGGTRILAVGSDMTLRTFACDACAPGDALVDVARRHVAFGRLGPP
jgi:WD40 repeat protein